MKKITKKELLKLYQDKNKTVKEIAAHFGLKRVDLYPLLKKFNIKYRAVTFFGDRNSHWRGGRKIRQDGYVSIYAPNHPFAISGRYVLEHRLIMEKKIGRYLSRGEIVHHINRDRQDNRIENLLLLSGDAEHLRLHRSEKTKKQIHEHAAHMRSFKTKKIVRDKQMGLLCQHQKG